jgi:ankyrin repeat protein
MLGETSTVNRLLENQAYVLAVNKYLQTPLHLAVLHANASVVEKLLSNGADVNAKDKDGKTALYVASEWGKEDIAKMIVNSRPGSPHSSTNIADKDGNCPLHASVAINHISLTKFLLSVAGASINAKNNMGRTPLHVLGEKGGSKQVLEILLQYSAELNFKDNDGNTPLHLSVGFCHQEVSVELCRQGASLCEVNDNDTTCLDDLPFGDQNAREEIQRRMLTNIPRPPTWLPDSASPHCQICKTDFTTKNRRHHCRNCGRLVCGKCSPSKKSILKWNLKGVRVCIVCDNLL